MRLTKKKAIELSIELWTWLAETGGEDKGDWPDLEQYGEILSDCFLCEYSIGRSGCGSCPYRQRFGSCCADDSPYHHWGWATAAIKRKKYARLFLEQLQSL